MANKVTKKIQRSSLERSKKIIAFKELTQKEGCCSQRTAAKLLHIPRSTIQDWGSADYDEEQVNAFFSSAAGAQLLHRIIVAAQFVIQYRGKGSRSVGEFILLSGLGTWVSHSHGAMHSFSNRFEEALIESGREEQKTLAQGMAKRKIILCEDETFHKSRPCLVAMDALSNYIFLEEYSDKRTSEAWDNAIEKAFEGLNFEIVSATSDEGTAILSHVKNSLQVEHSPDLFHIQQEISKATTAALKSQESSAEKEVEKTKRRLEKLKLKHEEGSPQLKEVEVAYLCNKCTYTQKKRSREDVRKEKKGIGEDYHPVNLKNGEVQTPEEVESSLNKRFDEIEILAKGAGLSNSSLRRIHKSRKMIKPLINYLMFFFILLKTFIEELQIKSDEATFFRKVLFPLAYLERQEPKMNKEGKEQLQAVIEGLKKKVGDGPVQGERLKWLKGKADEVSHLFQRSSSCVEGRNGVLSMMHHGFHGLSEKRLKALTVVHNFYIRRWDNSTPAERAFGKKHEDIFEKILDRVQIPGRPRKKWEADRNGLKPKLLVA